MKPRTVETFIIVTKLICHLVIGVFTPWAAALAQWANSGEWPSRMIWVGVILPASAVGGATAVLGFLSSSWTDYKSSGNVPPTQSPTP